MNRLQARSSGPDYHVDAVPCGCPSDDCVAPHVMRTSRPLSTPNEAGATLRSRRREARSRR
ncbi:hypothetical protein [Sphingomonas sp. G-3-2-10]|uniref:hypothetical protein n=1 Tax=Sphingomonas sp. G-3-2-10 TaxID=2728838 RepID=UPI00146CA98A|nr:hypothetical protein [Sphingomonas sp. G-3-2-10]NML04527.1 hypothetical protein [Sphingomonas sp. G-3-2-10]